ncbi:MAG: hypothetical protein HY831_02125, partial [Candidatus Aenigmarchaeota archaeon]|nr:hypothetical protein [Candidatus Aenigmarchaeota archaeon]MBI4895270.1 hypothetical protein [Candidatus Aenigmarchaeota archaeon]
TWRSEASVEHHEILGSLASTWHNHGLSPGKQLEKELCAIFSGAK